jgi:phosphoadenosine phosphosulfate reductase
MPVSSLPSSSEIKALAQKFDSSAPVEVLAWVAENFPGRAAIGTSFQGAGLVTIHHAISAGLNLPVFTIDTGLLFPETLELKDRLERFFEIEIEALSPELTVAEQGRELGASLWERNPDLCCTLRKVVPLQRKLSELDVWVSGLRREQSTSRASTQVLELYEFDKLRGKQIVKVNPLAAWTSTQVWDYIREHRIPYNPLRDRGFRSIGCAPCTRAVMSDESDRAGRWIGFEKNECGIHTFLGENI